MIIYTMPSTLVTVKCITMETTTKRNGCSKCVCKRGKSEAELQQDRESEKETEGGGRETEKCSCPKGRNYTNSVDLI